MQDNNPYQSGNGGYTTNVSFGAAEPSSAKPEGPLVFDTTTARFKADVLDASRTQPVLVDFWAPWCNPCRQLAPMIEKVVTEARGAVKLAKLNIDEHPQIPGQLGVQQIPAVIAFVNGQPVDGFMGVIPESDIRKFIDKLAGPAADPVAEALEAASEAAAAGDIQAALQIYGMILQQAPDNADALAGAATLLYDAGDKDQASELLAQVPADKANLPALEALRARMKLDDEVSALGDPLALARRLADDPGDHAARMDLAKIENARGARAEAADHLLAIIKADRGWNDEAAKTQLLEFFQVWGMTDPATLAARRKLSSLLFS